LEIDEFKASLNGSDLEVLSRQIMRCDTNWYFDESGEVDLIDGYQIFKSVVAAQVGVEPENVMLAGSSIYGYSLSPKAGKTFKAFHVKSDLDLVIISEQLFRAVWSELLAAYHSGYRWVMERHSDEVFRRFTVLIKNGSYKTNLLKNRVKILDGISRQVFLSTGSTREIKYRIYENEDAAIAYHASGLAKIKRSMEHDT
jgi:hypothetical protein